MQELSQWLSQLHTQWEKSLMTCTPADVIASLQDHWLEGHAGTTLPDGRFISSPSGVNQCLSSMSTGCSLIGRVTSWTPETPSGTPIQSSLVSSYCRLWAWRSGYLEGIAVPISVNLVHHAVRALLMWENSMRGKTVEAQPCQISSSQMGRATSCPCLAPCQ